MTVFLINLINRLYNFKVFNLVVPPYAVGTILEQLLALSLSKKKIDKILLYSPFFFQKTLKYENIAVTISKLIKYNKNPLFGGALYKILNFLLNIEFSIVRFFYKIVLKKKDYDFPNNIPTLINKNIKDYNTSFSSKHLYKFNFINNINKDSFSLEKNAEEECKKKIKNLDVSLNENIICLHVRDNAFHFDRNRRSFRNSDIDNYLEMINYFKNQNYIIFRMGVKVKKKLKIANKKNIIDYSFSDYNSRKFDYFLSKYCKFHIAGGGGFTTIPNLFNKPCLWTNDYRIYNEIPLNPLSRKIFKKIIWRKNKKKLAFSDYLKLPYSHHHVHYRNNELDFLENTPKEIYEAGKNFLQNIKKNNKNLSSIQKKFNKYLIKRYIKMYSDLMKQKKDNPNIINRIDEHFAFMALCLLNVMKGSFDHNFLVKNFDFKLFLP